MINADGMKLVDIARTGQNWSRPYQRTGAVVNTPENTLRVWAATSRLPAIIVTAIDQRFVFFSTHH